MDEALVVVDLQMDYFPGGSFPLAGAGTTLANVLDAVRRARENGIPVVLVQHVADPERGPAPFFNAGTPGVELHPELLAAAPGAPVVVKRFADAFHRTALAETLAGLGAKELLVCGAMTQNCVTHTAISKAAEAYDVTVLPDCCATVTELLHAIAIHALSTRLRLAGREEALVPAAPVEATTGKG